MKYWLSEQIPQKATELALQASSRLLKVVLHNLYIELPLLRYNSAYVKGQN